ncbi:5-formyltetrahydrofolate cyclo-ligase [Knoellia aerolata]|uniref:Ligase n=1 Tax=Knoellia aerolata DSM 18566 TaxID=1385519 RepID=A0A0A0JX93_9MICO|nr:5-formyltetrahydrofolate cyclo-ligase [Knoellia aerolata]KGN42025.1 ligase [Knoellia aerolata DSM 18566]
MTPDSVASAKVALRPILLAARRERVAARDRDADDAALAREVLALATGLGIGAGGTVAAYEALRTEPPTAASIDALVAHGIRVVVPVTLPDNDLDWCDVNDERRMRLGPDAISAAALVLTPGLAADLAGTRLGRGGGSYDRALARRRPDARVLVVLHPGEVHPEPLPADPHDQPVHGVLTADGVTWL